MRNAQLAVVDVTYKAIVLKGKEAAREEMARVARAFADHLQGSSSGV